MALMKTTSLKNPTTRPTGKTAPLATCPLPFKLQKILVPVDFSEYSTQAIQYAVPLATAFHAEMHFLHVLPINYSAGLEFEAPPYDPLIEGDTQRKIAAQLAALILQKVPNWISAKTEVRYGSPAMEIMDAARELGIDLIVMSTHGHTGRIHALIGSVAADVTRLAGCPVLVVHKPGHESHSNTIQVSASQAQSTDSKPINGS